MDTSLVEPEDLRRRQFLRLLLVSAFLHGLVVSALIVVPLTPSRRSLPAVVSVDLVSLPGAPAPQPAPAPPPAPPKALPKPEPTPISEPAPAPKPKKTLLPAKPRQDPEQAKPKPPKTVEYEDVLAQLRAERGEEAPTAPAPTVAPTPALAGGGIGRLDPERARWERAVRAHLSRNWVLAAGLRAQPLVAEVEVRLDARGNVIGDPEIVRRSGNPWFDDSVVRAVEKASPLPAPPEAGVEIIIFDPEDFF